ncbi:GIN domain-containing protein [Tenacibaculum amylolyticum]|uniref:GIN domain-containing protein n=1 Tax=Tenacibaculum amylolyticum TaxID=104269 RepID=UPI00389658CC
MIYKKLLLVLVVVVSLGFNSCSSDGTSNSIDGTNCTVTGEGTMVTQVLNLSNFSGINVSIAGNVTISQGATQNVEVIGQANIIAALSTSVSNNFWNIGFEGNCSYNYNELTINITVPNINQIELSGASDIVVNDFNNQNNQLMLDLTGTGTLTLNNFEGITSIDYISSGNVKTNINKPISTLNTMDVTISGTGDLSINEAGIMLDNLNISLIGDGDYKGFKIVTEDCTVTTTGTGNAEVFANNTLKVTISGTGNVSYKGAPTITQNITGTGQLIDAN